MGNLQLLTAWHYSLSIMYMYKSWNIRRRVNGLSLQHNCILYSQLQEQVGHKYHRVS